MSHGRGEELRCSTQLLFIGFKKKNSLPILRIQLCSFGAGVRLAALLRGVCSPNMVTMKVTSNSEEAMMNTLFLWATAFLPPLSSFSMLTQWTFPGFRENPENGTLCLRQNIFKMQHFHPAIPRPASLPSSLVLWPLFAGMCEGGTGSFSWLAATSLARGKKPLYQDAC